MVSPTSTTPKVLQEIASPSKTTGGTLLGKTVTVENNPQISFPPALQKTDLREVLLESVNDTLEALEIKYQDFLSADNKAFAAILEQRLDFWKGVKQEVMDESNPCEVEQLQTFYNFVQEDNALLSAPANTAVSQFILSTLSSFYINDLSKRLFVLQQLAESNEKLKESLEPHLRNMMKQIGANDLKEIARSWKEIAETALGEVENLEESVQARLQVLTSDLKILQKLFALEKFDVDVLSLIQARHYLMDAQILVSTLKEDSEEHKKLLPVLSQMQTYLQQGNPLGICMIWNNLLESQSEVLLNQEQDEETSKMIRFIYARSTPLNRLINLVTPGIILEGFSEKDIQEIMSVILKELLSIAEDIAVHHPEFTKNLGQWLGSYSTENRQYNSLVNEGKQGIIQHPTKMAVWVKDLSSLIEKGLQPLPEKYSKILEEAKRVADLAARRA